MISELTKLSGTLICRVNVHATGNGLPTCKSEGPVDVDSQPRKGQQCCNILINSSPRVLLQLYAQ